MTLQEQVRRVAAEGVYCDPTTVAEKVLAELSDWECREALKLTLPNWVRNVLGDDARHVYHTRVPAAGAPAGPSRADRIRNWYAIAIAQPLLGREWKRLGDCEQADLQAAADERFKAAYRTLAEAEKWKRLAAYLGEHRIATVGEVQPDVLYQLLQGESA
jgi:hypothetical protein